MMRLATFLFLLMLAASPGRALELTLEDCLAYALQNDRELKAQEALLEARSEDVSMARKSFLPTLKLNATYTLFDRPTRLIIGANTFGGGIPPEDVKLTDTSDTKSANLLLDQPLFTGGELKQNLRKSEAVEEQARLHLLRRKALVERDVAEGYFKALNLQMESQTIAKLLDARKERLRVLRELQAEGYVTRDDVLSQEADLAFAEAELFRSRTRARVALAHLRNQLYLDDGVELTLAAPSSYQSLAAEGFDLKTTAVQSRKDYRAMVEQIRGAEADVKKAESKLYPHVSLFGQYTRQDETNLNREEVWSAGARLEWSVFEWGKNLAEIRKASAEKQRLHYQREAFARDIINETEDLWGEALAMEKVVEAHAAKTRASESRLDNTMAGYAEGQVRLDEVLAQEADMISSYHDYLAATNQLGIILAYLKASLANQTEGWLTTKEFYRPNLERLTDRLKQVRGITNEATKPAAAPSPTPGGEGAYAIQLGAYSSRENAELFLRQAAVRIPGAKVEVIDVAGIFKVRAVGFTSQEEAQGQLAVMQSRLGTKAFVVRTSHEH